MDITIVFLIVPFMFPSKLSSVLFIASYYAILKVSVISKVINLVKIKRNCKILLRPYTTVKLMLKSF